jgi:hypothetical protein
MNGGNSRKANRRSLIFVVELAKSNPTFPDPRGCAMRFMKPRDLARGGKPAAIDGNMPNVGHPGDIVRQMSLMSTNEIDRLIHDLENLRGKLEIDSNRIQAEIVEYASLSQSAGQLTKIVSDSVTHVKSGSDDPKKPVRS